MADANQQWIYVAHPRGFPKLDEQFRLEPCGAATAADGQVVIRNRVFSVDPYLRGRMSASHGYLGAWHIGNAPTSIAAGEVVESKNPDFAVGDFVLNFETPWRRVYASDGKGVTKVTPGDFPLRYYVGPLGMAGLTAYFASQEIGMPKAGDTVFLSGAAGAVGSIAGQIFKIHGCTVIGSAGSDEKVAFLKSIGFDGAFNYKTTDTRKALQELAPEGLDIYFDNVGGETLEIALDLMKRNGRVIMCGSISQYNVASPEERYGVKNLFQVVVKQLRMEGFLVGRWSARFPEGVAKLAEWVKTGKLKVHETVVKGFDKLPTAFLDMLKGENIGKMVVEL